MNEMERKMLGIGFDLSSLVEFSAKILIENLTRNCWTMLSRKLDQSYYYENVALE